MKQARPQSELILSEEMAKASPKVSKHAICNKKSSMFLQVEMKRVNTTSYTFPCTELTSSQFTKVYSSNESSHMLKPPLATASRC
jgi:hypothetical protein